MLASQQKVRKKIPFINKTIVPNLIPNQAAIFG